MDKEYKHAEITDLIVKAFYVSIMPLDMAFWRRCILKHWRELRKLRVEVVEQAVINVYYLGQIVGEYYADLLVNRSVIVEVKAVQMLADEHEAQLLNYLKATLYEVGLL